ncbi:MAG TPA: hypothetical protein VM470_03475 [Acidimicrobiia bacterium]|nr:hypothetical protein [Acidimicrobiia bacterium]
MHLVEYPLPNYEGRPWSQWGQGMVGGDGRFISAVGDHHGVDGNSFFFAFDPATSTLTRFSDVLSHTNHQPGDFGFGKVHAQMVAGNCGEVYAHTYWGSRRNLEYGDSYRGDLLFRIDSGTEVIELLGIPEEERGTASMAGSPDGRMLYLEAVEPVSNQTDLVIYDIFERETVATIVDSAHTGRRAMAVSDEGSVFFSSGSGDLAFYDPSTGEVSDTGSTIPGKMLRAATYPGPDGTMVAVSSDPDEFFKIDPSGRVEPLGDAPGYTASLALSPDGRHVYFIPGAHGNSWESGTPLLDLDPASGDMTTIVKLAEPVAEAAGVRTGGTYSVVMDPAGERLYIGLNVGEGDESFGRVFLAIVELPK